MEVRKSHHHTYSYSNSLYFRIKNRCNNNNMTNNKHNICKMITNSRCRQVHLLAPTLTRHSSLCNHKSIKWWALTNTTRASTREEALIHKDSLWWICTSHIPWITPKASTHSSTTKAIICMEEMEVALDTISIKRKITRLWTHKNTRLHYADTGQLKVHAL
jgi:hypothetical protein